MAKSKITPNFAKFFRLPRTKRQRKIPEDIEKTYNRQRQESTRAKRSVGSDKLKTESIPETALMKDREAGGDDARLQALQINRKIKSNINNSEEFDPGSG